MKFNEKAIRKQIQINKDTIKRLYSQNGDLEIGSDKAELNISLIKYLNTNIKAYEQELGASE